MEHAHPDSSQDGSFIDATPARFALTRRTLWIVFGVWAGISALTGLAMYGAAIAGANDIMIGGDFVVFFTAAKAAAAGDAAAIYEAADLQARLNAAFPGRDDLDLYWPYPPTYFLVIAGFAFLPHYLGFALFSGGSAAIYGVLLRRQINDNLLFFAIIASPAAFAAFITGQNSFLTAALFLLAAANPKGQPILAGMAAGLLTMKPHLGLLIPVAYLAAGCWRAIFVAIATALFLAALSYAAYGPEPWLALLSAWLDASARVSDQVMPLAKMATPYAAALYAGFPLWWAQAFSIVMAVIAAAAVWLIWARCTDHGLRACILISTVMLATPYGYYYELIILGAPVAIIVMQAMRNGWLKGERTMLAAAWLLTIATSFFYETSRGVSTSFIAVFLIFAIVVRRAVLFMRTNPS